MTTKMGLWALGLFTIGSAIVVSCGGSSEDGDETGGSAGTSSGGSAGIAGAGGTPTGGSTGTAGTGTSGSATGGTGGAPPSGGGEGPDFPGGGGDGPSFPGAGGDGPSFPGAGGDGPSFPGAGGDGPTAQCPATQPTDGDACTLQSFVGCDYGDVTCNCRRTGGGQGQGMRAWDCGEGGPGAGGAGGTGPGFGEAQCPEGAQDDDACTGTGLCSGQQCVCLNGSVNCFD